MSSYCLKCRKNTKSKNPKAVKTKNGRMKFLSKCPVWGKKNLNLSNSKKLADY